MAHGGTHIAVGAAVGAVAWRALGGHALGAGAAALTVGAVTHALLDVMPHDDDALGPWWETVWVLLSAAAVIGLAAPWTRWCVLLGALGGAGPDLEHVPGWLGRPIRKHFPTHTGRLPHNGSPRRQSFVCQGLLAAASFSIVGLLAR